MQNRNKNAKQLSTNPDNAHISNMYVYPTVNDKY